jgi:hypothetical protein
MRWMIVAATLALTEPAAAFEDVDGSLARVPEKQRAAIVRLLDLNVPDGPTARVRDVKPLKWSENQWCGLINSKNAAGAYAGYRKFVTVFDLNVAWVEGGSMDRSTAAVFQSSHTHLCKD